MTLTSHVHRRASFVAPILVSLLVALGMQLVAASASAQPKPRPGSTDREVDKPEDAAADPRDRLGPKEQKEDAEKAKKKAEEEAAAAEGPLHHFSVDGIGFFPVSDWSDVAGVGVGAGARHEYVLNQRWQLVTEVGYVYHFENEVRDLGDASFTQTITELFVLFGGKLDIPLAAGDDRAFALAMVGINWLTFDTIYENSPTLQDSVLTSREWMLFVGGGYSFDQFSLRGGAVVSAVGRNTANTVGDEGPLDDYTGTLSAVGMFGYHFASL